MHEAETSSDYDRAKGEEEHILQLLNKRRIAYAHIGPEDSRTVIIFFHGLFGVGTAPSIPEPFLEDGGAHWIAPTLPGMGNSSSRDLSVPYHVTLARAMSELLSHFYPTDAYDKLYLSGGSYGTVQAQMLYGAPYELFPPGRKIAGCLLLSGFTPLNYHVGYEKSLSWQNWFSIGPHTKILPFHMLQWLFRLMVGFNLRTVDGAKKFLHQTLFQRMDDNERLRLKQWLLDNELSEDEFVEKMARGAVENCHNWDGFMEVSDVIHSDWGFEPKTLDYQHASKPILIVGSEADQIGGSTNDWLVDNYKSSSFRLLPGGHISSLFYMDELWRELINAVNGS